MFLVIVITSAKGQETTGNIAGKLTDKEYNNEPLSFANVILVGENKGTTTDMDGLYNIGNLEPGVYTIEFSYVGYETITIPDVKVEAGKVTEISTAMGATAATLDEVTITTVARRDSEVALLLEQKSAINVKESIGAEQLESLGVSDASAATTKISGVSKSEGSGQIYVRGLGDRYLTTTLNGLPIPSDNIDKKNIDLELFPTSFISNVSISKTFSSDNSSDQASGNVDVTSKNITKRKDFGLSFSSGMNTNAVFVADDFKATALDDDTSFGIFSRPYETSNLRDALTDQSWNTVNIDNPVNYSLGFTAGGFIDEEGKFRLSFSGSQSVNHEYREGFFRFYDRGLTPSLEPFTGGGGSRDFVPDGDNRYWNKTVNTNGLLVGQYRINENNRLKLNAFAINKVAQELYEAGRSGEAIFFDELTPNGTAGNQFVRDQNIKNTFLATTQLIGDHDLSQKNKLEWALGYNRLAADEPNRIRNELNFRNVDGVPQDERPIELGNTGGLQQRKTSQEILDQDINGRIKDIINLKVDEEDNTIYKLSFGGDGRFKQREFLSKFVGFEEGGNLIGAFNPESIDNLSDFFTRQNEEDGVLKFNEQDDDIYDAELTSYGVFADFVGVFGKFTAQVGLRYQSDEIYVDYDVNNAPGGRQGDALKNYENIYPSFNLKYDLDERMAIRLAGSMSQTLPEFKEIAPFEYVSPEGLIEAGNRLVERSQNINIDLKYEFFPTNDQLFSVTTYYKRIEDAINRSLRLGGGDVFSFYNTGDARILGIELEGRVNLLETEQSKLKLSGNVSYINHIQDLKDRSEGINVNGSPRTFQYGGNTEIGLEGASDWTTNLALSFETGKDLPYQLTIATNYASDSIYSLGAPVDVNPEGIEDTNFNGEIYERGFVVLDFVLNKEINENLSIGLTGKNLLNPDIERYQKLASEYGISSKTQEETVLSYKRGINFSFNISYKF